MPQTGKPFGRGVILSIAIHILIIIALIWRPDILLEASKTPGGEGPRGGGGGGGSQQVSFIKLDFPRSSAQAVSVPDPTPMAIPVPSVPEIKIEDPKINIPEMKIEVAGQIRGQGAGTGGDRGAGTGTGGGVGGGVGTGVGNDRGPGTGGDGGEIFPPKLRYANPWFSGAPRGIRGGRYTIYFSVDETGRVTDIDVRPIISDAEYRQRFLNQAREWTFEPALTRDGRPVKAVYPVTVTIGG
jgi:hypothetical protein